MYKVLVEDNNHTVHIIRDNIDYDTALIVLENYIFSDIDIVAWMETE